MTGVFVHDAFGNLRSFGIAGETRKVRAGLLPSDGTVIVTVEVTAGDFEKLRNTRGHISANLAIAGTPKEPKLRIRTSGR